MLAKPVEWLAAVHGKRAPILIILFGIDGLGHRGKL
jgi:hypothetical protein